MIGSKLNRRTWLKQGALAAGTMMSGSIIANPLMERQAFGFKPFQKKYNLLEKYHIAPPDISKVKVRLLANENPWGPSKKTIAAVSEAASMGNRYVYNSSRKLEKILAEREGVSVDHILLAPGSTDLLEKTAFATLMNGGNVISGDPSYMSLINTATSIGASWKNIKLKEDYSYDLDAMEKAIDSDTKLIYICNPNNPTGTLTSKDKIISFSKKVASKVPVFIDEAYLELLDDPEANTTVGLVKEGHDVMVCRTFSKIHGMAGLRIGYMVAQPERIEKIKSLVRTEMGISVTSLYGAMASLEDVGFQNFTRTHNKECREYVYSELKKAGLNPIPSYTSFILFPIQMPTEDFLTKMFDKGVGIRGFEIFDKPYSRVSMGTMDEVKIFVKTLNEIVS